MLFEIAIEIMLEMYMELMLLIVPDKKLKKWQIAIAKVVAILVILGMLALVIWGITLISDHGDPKGYIPISLAVIISVIQIVSGIILYKKHHDD